jgi:uncharacterized membrane protein YgcG
MSKYCTASACLYPCLFRSQVYLLVKYLRSKETMTTGSTLFGIVALCAALACIGGVVWYFYARRQLRARPVMKEYGPSSEKVVTSNNIVTNVKPHSKRSDTSYTGTPSVSSTPTQLHLSPITDYPSSYSHSHRCGGYSGGDSGGGCSSGGGGGGDGGGC